VTHTFIKVRQESRDADPLLPYSYTVSYREFVYHSGCWKWAFDLLAPMRFWPGAWSIYFPISRT
jgi:hypothetical protein